MGKLFKDLLIRGESIVTEAELDEYLKDSYEKVVKKTKEDIERYNLQFMKARRSSFARGFLLAELSKNKK